MNKFDLIVVGGGIMGTFHAYHALMMGKKVLLFERDNYPVGATVRNFGQVVPSGMANEWFEYGRQGLEVYKSIQEEMDISIRNNGSVYIASDDDEQLLLHELKAHFDAKNYTSQLLTKDQILQKYPAIKSSYAKEALFFPQEVSVEPDVLIYKIQSWMKERFENFEIHYNVPVVDCEDKGSDVKVLTAGRGMYTAGQVVICSGNEFKLLFPGVFRESGIVVSKLQMMRTVPMPEVALEGNILTGLTIRRYESFETHCPSFHKISIPDHYHELKRWGIHILFKKAADGSIIIGDSHEYAAAFEADDLGFKLNQYINELMLMEAARIVDFDVKQIAQTWAGYYPQHKDNIFHADLGQRIHIRTAIGGKGMTASIGFTAKSTAEIFQ
ncbi:TIGR03364 family FAD-dependent oxidoreductase [Chitinophaga caeni]|uniref:TIGR03364 family FAD-dependent oxidoreductase n=1 Tax=Chitinophaga caeni TaxID=2029983 RepID=A0A291R173_9BACT|nr:TIGR03364 family FAD-dependent oxidoreductase [Chitinophaga caeni]ATL49948.1 TIGR03364 family FAD-dependent oxidoreductase [Chitinophaga caeni]